MRAVRQLLRRSREDRALLMHALVLHTGIVALVRLVPFQRLRRWLSAAYAPTRGGRPGLDQMAWAVRTAAAVAPAGKSCLTEALALQCLLRRHGHDAALRIGVAKAGGPSIEAHAWLEHEGRIVIGGDAALEYQPLRAARTTARG